MSRTQRIGVWYAIIAALLFGASTPLAKGLLGTTDALLLAGLLYCGSGAGLGGVLCARALFAPNRRSGDWPVWSEFRWLGAAILLGGVVAPPLLLYGLMSTPASSASLLLNLESVLTALVAWFLFRENFDRRIALGMAAIVGGSLVLSWVPGQAVGLSRGALLVGAACGCWALDNNLTRRVSQRDPLAIAALKGVVAGMVNLGLAFSVGNALPDVYLVLSALAVGFAGYGVSLVLFVLALRHLGAARTGAYFAVAPFFGALYALLVQHEPVTIRLAAAAALMALGVWLHITERHAHRHTHEPLEHAHPHVHDEHHRHEHDFPWDGAEPHAHPHAHARLEHEHAHVPDILHRHPH